ncbi:MAG: aminotransferase class III-fold pyridoxal phosphate-dependent enzyme, partial [Spirochaetes bacterium]|nr:aminotransferase class III-fold pyridoxal phosphate-dependent enzyme [Spirochaetota bacterium]
MAREFNKNIGAQREKFKVTEKALMDRIESAPFGEKTKELAKKWAQCESFGGVGWGIFDVTPVMERSKGAHIYDVDGKEYIDLLSGFAVNALGGCNEEITKIIREQAGTLTHFFDFPHVERIKMAEKLIKNSRISGKTRVMFGVTGSDGIELAVRAARYYTGQPYIL